MPKIRTPIAAIVTPFTTDGAVDWTAMKTYLSSLESWGVPTILTNGTTGEFPSLTLEERQQVVEFARAHFGGALINHVSSTCVQDVKRLVTGCLSHADAILILPPYYFAGAGHAGLLRFFKAALENNTLPVYLYNFPRHTGNTISPQLAVDLMASGMRLAGVKDSSGDVSHAHSYIDRIRRLEVYLGNDAKALEALQKGLAGSVTGGANALPEFLVAIHNLHLAGDSGAAHMQETFNRWNEYRGGSHLAEIPLVKAALAARIKDFPIHVRPPFTAVTKDEQAAIAMKIGECLNSLATMSDRAC